MRLVPTLGAVLAVAGCAVQPDPDMALACQTRRCVCLPEDAALLRKAKPAPVEWRANGDAYCPDGHVLRFQAKDK